MTGIRVLIVDDEVVREGLRRTLAQVPSVTIVGAAANGSEACAQAAWLQPDIVIVDLAMPGMNGAETTRRLRETPPGSRIIALTVHDESPYVSHLLDAGARGYVLKRASIDHLVKAVTIVAAGGTFLDPELAYRPTEATVDIETVRRAAELTPRETVIASLMARGHTNAEIAADLRISVKTVETHRSRVMAKTGLRTRAELVRYARYRGWI